MARVKAPKNFFTFVGGKVSDANPLNPVENTARILMNVDLEPNGKISRRLGLDLEANSVLDNGPYTISQLQSLAVDTFEWTNVANSDTATFFILRVGNTLNFYDEGAVPFSSGKIGELDVGQFATNAGESAKSSLRAISGKGELFCTGPRYNPFKIVYDALLQTFTGEELVMEKRDFDGVDDGLTIDERPSSLSDLHHYNLRNQGWTEAHINTFKSSIGTYPSNADVESLGFKVNEDGDRVWSASEVVNQSLGNTHAARGHFILDIFDEDRLTASGLFGLPAGGTTFRTEAVTFFAGRIWYASIQGEVFFSQILTSLDKAGKCYQDQDPTSEEFNELLDTDGGVIRILQSGTVKALVPSADGVLVMATNGIWLIAGGDVGFTANNTFVNKVSDVQVTNPNSIVEAEGTIFFWSEEGIFALVGDKVTGRMSAESLTKNRIQQDYNEIPAAAKALAHGEYDRVRQRIYWSFHDGQTATATALDPKYNSMLVFDTALNAFWDYKIEDVPKTFASPFMAGTIKRSAVSEGSSILTITVNGDPVFEQNGLNQIVSTTTFKGSSDTPLKVVCFIPDGNEDYQVTFGEFCSRSFHDWFDLDQLGVNYESAVETNPESLGEASFDKQATYLHTWFDFKRGGFGELLFTARFDPTKGFRASQYVVEVLRAGVPLLRVTQYAVETLRAGTPKLRSTQNVIEVLRAQL